MPASKRIGDLKPGDAVRLEPGGRGRITGARPQDGAMVLPHRASADRIGVPAWYVIWRDVDTARETGGLFDPDDRVLLS